MLFDIETVAAILFVIALSLFLYSKKGRMHEQQLVKNALFFSMYRTKIGLRLMDSLSKKFRRSFEYIGYLGILLCFIGMALISYLLIDNIAKIFLKPEAVPGVGLVLPVKAKGIFYVPFFYWIISIFVIAFVHEFAHGIIARAHNIKVKSSGFAFLGSTLMALGFLILVFTLPAKIVDSPFSFDFSSSSDLWLAAGTAMVLISLAKNLKIPAIPAAFVEPDEKELKKRPHSQQLSVFAAGPFSNIALAFIILAFLGLIVAPLSAGLFEDNGVEIVDLIESQGKYPAELAGISAGEVVKEIDGQPIKTAEEFSSLMETRSPQQKIRLKTDISEYSLLLASNPDNSSRAFLGIKVAQSTGIKAPVYEKYGNFIPAAYVWLIGLLSMLMMLNFGIGLFNLAPIGPLDGGRMMQLLLHKLFDKEKGDRLWKNISIFFLVIIIFNLAYSFIG
ncbi:site-2 protease family protein [Candidatus Woesearchaeota archaeon]|nr:site-2 protease family protein [Candidatus Woesearchaeota archaeon]